jgi:hypothetical protein
VSVKSDHIKESYVKVRCVEKLLVLKVDRSDNTVLVENCNKRNWWMKIEYFEPYYGIKGRKIMEIFNSEI